jgi:hypothetical protein
MTAVSGEELKASGMAAAAASAGPTWMAQAAAFAIHVGALSLDGTFTTEDVRAMSTGILAEPPNLKSWGAVMGGLARQGKIKRVGFVRARNKSVHAMHVTLWQLADGA